MIATIGTALPVRAVPPGEPDWRLRPARRTPGGCARYLAALA
ncbi:MULTISPECIES: hypothetical protein [Xanthomonas]|nr:MULTISPECIES: hypothetical protein [Xanthomonas]